jgi:hypothetical protein
MVQVLAVNIAVALGVSSSFLQEAINTTTNKNATLILVFFIGLDLSLKNNLSREDEKTKCHNGNGKR